MPQSAKPKVMDCLASVSIPRFLPRRPGPEDHLRHRRRRHDDGDAQNQIENQRLDVHPDLWPGSRPVRHLLGDQIIERVAAIDEDPPQANKADGVCQHVSLTHLSPPVVAIARTATLSRMAVSMGRLIVRARCARVTHALFLARVISSPPWTTDTDPRARQTSARTLRVPPLPSRPHCAAAAPSAHRQRPRAMSDGLPPWYRPGPARRRARQSVGASGGNFPPPSRTDPGGWAPAFPWTASARCSAAP